ncbi:putative quinol monooxygenase [Salinibius halmophilus]|uniref:putative quinol monooxygenase n=1 Tax=Salinibius halmophilus TaxID=1853216 RepID=UPI000E664A24|nr:antibiotic biosynthesis monooxygenase family protein [Salinibius halmophilus]
MAVTLSGYILVPTEQLKVVKEALIEHTRLTREEPGCLRFEVVQCPDNPLRFNVFEVFVDKAAFEHHQQRVQASYWGSATQDVQRFYQVSDLERL